MAGPLARQLEKALGAAVTGSRPMRGGDIADVSRLSLSDGRTVVAKRPRADQPDTTATEAMMLTYLAEHSPLPVPKVLYQADGILVMEHIAHAGSTNAHKAAISIAGPVAALHRVTGKRFGFQTDTVIGPLGQQNREDDNWCRFFTENRLLAMAGSCARVARLSPGTMARIEKLAQKLPDLLPASPAASLLHGDIWAGNMLIDGETVAAFIDPAISYGDREMDLAFIALMGGLDPVFFDAYHAQYAIDAGFTRERCAIYQLWPLLVHVRLFGGGYVGQVESILARFGV
ncbi:MAG: fructosamine kinase [Alphaproteobacteria bacterium]|nr:MAG: fructosamine kinase [Alphaproteobacteria bacterium]